MHAEISYRNQPPGLMGLYGKALLPKGKQSGGELTIPELSASLIGVSTDNAGLARYARVCGFANSHHVPLTWPHIMAFPLHLKLLTDKRFPLPLLGLVHLRNSITQHRPIGVGECLDIRVSLGNQQRTDRGLEFDLLTEARANGQLVWEESSTTLFRQAAKAGADKPANKTPPSLERFANSVSVKAVESLGRQYGRISGDLNPIHMAALTAKAFGFPRAIAHGMWSKAHCLARLEQSADWQPGQPVTITCNFKKPLFLPGTAQLNWKKADNQISYQLLNSKGDAPHLSGEIWFG